MPRKDPHPKDVAFQIVCRVDYALLEFEEMYSLRSVLAWGVRSRLKLKAVSLSTQF
ncbi:MAG: hypothetical protein LH660_22250 [Phormidesmis sp. CAN_BIN36]|nr:hypothetical protein [Phormidesmis sp. CAN_BIN36]